MTSPLIAFADESGTQQGSPLTVVAGYVASPRQWRKVRQEWNQVVRREGISELHTVELMNRSGEFRGWSDRRVGSCLNGFVEILAPKMFVHPIGGMVNVDDFNSFSLGERRFLTNARIKKSGRFASTGAPKRLPYQLAFTIFLNAACELAKSGTTVDFCFDRNGQEAGYAKQVFEEIKSEIAHPNWERLGRLDFADSKDEIAVQAADLYSYLLNSVISKGHDSVEQIQRDALKRLLGNRKWTFDYIKRPQMEQSFMRLNPAQKAAMKSETD